MAKRSTARWCSDLCRLRAWRRSSRAAELRDLKHLQRQLKQLRAALAEIENMNPCAAAGCQNAPGPQASTGRPWRDAERNDPVVRTLRSRLTEVRREVERLRDENVVLRHWIRDRLDSNRSREPGD